MVHELQRCRTGAAFLAVDDDEVGCDTGLDHRLADCHELPGMSDAQFETGRLAARKTPHLGNELHQFDWSPEGSVVCRRQAVFANANTADLRNFLGYLGSGQHAAVTWLGALAELQFDHFDLWIDGCFGEPLGRERTIAIAGTEIT